MVRRLVGNDGIPKGMRIVLQEKRVNMTKMKAKDMRFTRDISIIVRSSHKYASHNAES